MVKFRDVQVDGSVDFTNDEDGWIDTTAHPDAELVDLPVPAILLTNAAHSSEHIGKKMVLVQSTPSLSPRYCFVGELTALRSKVANLTTEWLFLYLQTEPARRAIAKAVEGAHLIPRSLGQVEVLYPPIPSQEHVWGFLKSVDSTIEALGKELVAAQRLKTALMQQLFTRGIPGRHTTFRKTKIGRIPDEWDVTSLGGIADIDAGVALNPEREPRNNGYRYLTVVNVQRERLDLSEIRHLELWDSEIPGKLLKEGDIVAVEGHANSGEIGRAAMVTAEADGMAFQNHLFRVRLRPEVDFNARFLLGCMNSERVRRHWNATANTSSGLNTINRRGLRKLLVPQPRRDEQDDIVVLINSADANIQATENELIAVRRLKTSLLQNLLTGKVRVNMET